MIPISLRGTSRQMAMSSLEFASVDRVCAVRAIAVDGERVGRGDQGRARAARFIGNQRKRCSRH